MLLGSVGRDYCKKQGVRMFAQNFCLIFSISVSKISFKYTKVTHSHFFIIQNQNYEKKLGFYPPSPKNKNKNKNKKYLNITDKNKKTAKANQMQKFDEIFKISPNPSFVGKKMSI